LESAGCNRTIELGVGERAIRLSIFTCKGFQGDRRANVETRLSIALCFTAAAASFAVSGFAQEKKQAAAAVDPKAIAALEKMGGYLRSLKVFEVTAATMTDEVTEDNMKIQLAGNTKLQVRRPDRLRAETISDRKQRQLYYDGKSITLYGPRVKYYATVAAPSTLHETVEVLTKKYGVELPLADLFYWGTDKAPVQDIKSAYYVGPATVDGTPTDHYAFRQEGVDWQIWIEKGNTPLPRKLVLTSTDEATQPEHIATLRWNVAPSFDETTFSFKPPPGAMKIVMQTADGKVDNTSK
jgi:hypothetical protein